MKTYIQTYSSFAYNSPKLETIQMSINWWKDKQISKQQYIHTIEYYSAITRNKLLTDATIWRDFKGILFSEKNATLKWLHIIQFHLYNTWITKS